MRVRGGARHDVGGRSSRARGAVLRSAGIGAVRPAMRQRCRDDRGDAAHHARAARRGLSVGVPRGRRAAPGCRLLRGRGCHWRRRGGLARVIKYIGSKRVARAAHRAQLARRCSASHRLRPVRGHDARRAGAAPRRRSSCTRTTARPTARRSAGPTSRPTRALDRARIAELLAHLAALPGRARLLHRDVLRASRGTSSRATACASTRSATRSTGSPLTPSSAASC